MTAAVCELTEAETRLRGCRPCAGADRAVTSGDPRPAGGAAAYDYAVGVTEASEACRPVEDRRVPSKFRLHACAILEF